MIDKQKDDTSDNTSIKENNKYKDDTSETSKEYEDFDWDDIDSEEETDPQESYYHKKTFFLCLSSSSSRLSWIIFIILTLISVGICITVFITVKPQRDPTMTSYNLALWFTFIAFMFCITLLMQMIIEVFPWLFKKITTVSTNAEISRFKFLPYYTELKPYTKLVFIGAWAWGSWTFLRIELDLPDGTSRPDYVQTLELVWEILFLLLLFIFIEKFILQFIVTSFHKKAYGDRLSSNERALRILEKLKHVKRSQHGLFKRIYKKTGCYISNEPGKSTMNQEENSDRIVRFPSKKRIDTLIAIPAVNTIEKDVSKRNYFKNLIKPFHKSKKNQQEDVEDDTFYDEETEADTEVEEPIEESEKAQEADEEEQERVDRNTEEYENKKHPKLIRSNSNISSLSTESSRSTTSILYNEYMKLLQESAFQDPIHQAKNLAKRIYINIMGTNPPRTHMFECDFFPYFRTLKEAKEAFKLFDADDNGDISRRELRSGCIRIYRDRRDLARSMRDMSQATGKLDILLLAIFICIWIIVSMAVFGVNVGTQLTPLWSAFIAASFIFGNSAKDAFESIIFVFVTHPFDTGDRILIEENNWIVSNVGIMVSTFLKLDGSIIYAKNSILATKYIINCRRTGRTSETFDIQISFYTPSWKIQELRDRMVIWVNQFPKLYTKDACGANISSIQNLNKITVSFFFEHTKNWQDAAGRWLRHNNFVLELKDQLQKLDITYNKPDQPVLLKYYGDEEKELEDDDDNILRHRKGWSNTSNVQNHAGSSNVSQGPGDIPESVDAGAAIGAAATVAYTTGAI